MGRGLTRGEEAYSRGGGLLEGKRLTRGEGAHSRRGGLLEEWGLLQTIIFYIGLVQNVALF